MVPPYRVDLRIAREIAGLDRQEKQDLQAPQLHRYPFPRPVFLLKYT